MPEVGFNSVLAHRWQITFHFNLYRDFLSSQEQLADQALKDWMQKIDEEAKTFEEEAQAEFYEFHSEEYTSREYSKTILMNSFFVGAYALFEDQRNRIIRRYSLSKQKLSGSQLVHSQEWIQIEHYSLIRNKIMHEGGTVPECREAMTYAQRKDIVAKYFPEGAYALTREFCDEALGNFEQCLLNAITEFATQVAE